MDKDEALKLALEALLDIIEGSRIDSVGNRNDDGLLDHNGHHDYTKRVKAAQYAIVSGKGALAQPVQEQGEPLAIIHRNEYNEYRLEPHDSLDLKSIPFNVDVPLYITPQPRPWVELTDGEIKTILSQVYCDINQMKLTLGDGPQKETVGFLFAKGIGQALKEKNT